MTFELLIKEIQKDPENETEVLWFKKWLKKVKENPLDKFKKRLFLDFNLRMPGQMNMEEYSLLIVLIILLCKWDLEEGSVPGSYRLTVEEMGYIDELEDVRDYTLSLLTKMILYYYGASEKNEIDKLENAFENEIDHWNWSGYVKQEQVIGFAGTFMKDVAEKSEISDRYATIILKDYYDRIEKKRLNNLNSFLRKSEKILKSSENLKEQTKFFSKILDEINNGGENLNSVQDIIPYYQGMKFN